jgi:hypothetical protein
MSAENGRDGVRPYRNWSVKCFRLKVAFDPEWTTSVAPLLEGLLSSQPNKLDGDMLDPRQRHRIQAMPLPTNQPRIPGNGRNMA